MVVEELADTEKNFCCFYIADIVTLMCGAEVSMYES